MKVEYREVGDPGGWTLLMDEAAGHTLEPWSPKYSAGVQVDDLAENTAEGGSAFTRATGNIKCALSLQKMVVGYATAAAALAASRTVPTAFLNLDLNLKVTEGAEVQYFPRAVCASCVPDVQGSCVVYSMELTTQMVTDEEPE